MAKSLAIELTLLAPMMLIARILAHFDTWMLGCFDARLDTFTLMLLSSMTPIARMLTRFDPVVACIVLGCSLVASMLAWILLLASIPIALITLLIARIPARFDSWSLG